MASYIHMGGRIGVLVEVNCRKRTLWQKRISSRALCAILQCKSRLQSFMLSSEEVPQDTIDKEKRDSAYQAINEGKPEKDRKQYGGRSYKKYFKEVCLLDQPFVKDPDKGIADYVKETNRSFGREHYHSSLYRYEMGEPAKTKIIS